MTKLALQTTVNENQKLKTEMASLKVNSFEK